MVLCDAYSQTMLLSWVMLWAQPGIARWVLFQAGSRFRRLSLACCTLSCANAFGLLSTHRPMMSPTRHRFVDAEKTARLRVEGEVRADVEALESRP